MTVRDIANALKDGGVESTEASFENNMTGALHRLKASGEVLRFKDGWALAEFYPESLRARIAKDVEPKRRRKKPGRAKETTSEEAKTVRRAMALTGPIATEKAS
jgi:hypothetical protein